MSLMKTTRPTAEYMLRRLSELGIKVQTKFTKETGVNYLKLPVTVLKPNEEGAAKFNEVLHFLRDECHYSDTMRFTKSGGIQKKGNPIGYGKRVTRSQFEIVAWIRCGCFRVMLSANYDAVNEGGLNGRQAYWLLKKEFEADGIHLDDYATDTGLAVKQTIESPMISLTAYAKEGKTYEHVHHLDLHSAYPSGLVANYPEMAKTIERIYAGRKIPGQGKRLKLAMDASIGFFQSPYCIINGNGYALANLSKKAIAWTNKTIISITVELLKSGYRPLAYNTDGIWYAKLKDGETIASEPFHGTLEGDGLGRYANDHIDCRIRWKSKGSYEFIENGVCKPVVRGSTRLDFFKPRSEWEWGDIFRADATVFKLSWKGDYVETIWEE